MTCPAISRLAAAASGADDALLVAHAADCEPCRAALAEQHEVHALVRHAPPPPPLSDRDRQALAAEVMARLDAADVVRMREDEPAVGEGQGARAAPRHNLVAAVTFTTAIAAAAAVVLVALASRSSPQLARTPDVSGAPPAVALPEASPPPPPPAPAAPATPSATDLAGVTGPTAVFERETTAAHDRVRLREGALEIDALVGRPIQIITGATEIAVPTRARASVVARKGVIESVAVFAGSVEIVVGDRRQRVEAGATWERSTLIVNGPVNAPARPVDPPTRTEPADDASSLAAFREGWTALRAADHRAAIAAFDRATATVVAEDAAYWAAIACERAGDRGEAARRYTAFVARFPDSPRVEAARIALARASR